MVEIGDEVVHQSHPGRFTVIAKEASPGLNVYSDIITVRSSDGVELRMLDTAVRVLEAPPGPVEKPAAKAAAKPQAEDSASSASPSTSASAAESASSAAEKAAEKG